MDEIWIQTNGMASQQKTDKTMVPSVWSLDPQLARKKSGSASRLGSPKENVPSPKNGCDENLASQKRTSPARGC